MHLDDINIIGSPLALSLPSEVDEAEQALGITFPADYRAYVTRFGEGVLGGSYIRVYPPHRILAELGEWRRRIDEYWFWDDGAAVLTKSQTLECIIVGDTLDGDELVVHPSHRDRVYVLPRHSGDIFIAGEGLMPTIDWLCSSGVLTDPFDEREFKPYNSST